MPFLLSSYPNQKQINSATCNSERWNEKKNWAELLTIKLKFHSTTSCLRSFLSRFSVLFESSTTWKRFHFHTACWFPMGIKITVNMLANIVGKICAVLFIFPPTPRWTIKSLLQHLYEFTIYFSISIRTLRTERDIAFARYNWLQQREKTPKVSCGRESAINIDIFLFMYNFRTNTCEPFTFINYSFETQFPFLALSSFWISRRYLRVK